MQIRTFNNVIPVVTAMTLSAVLLVASCTIPPGATGSPAPSSTSVGIEIFADGFDSPIAMEFPPDGSGRAFVVDQTGYVYIVDPAGRRVETPFLDIRDQMVRLSSVSDERGLLGLAFHPDFAANGRFYVYYTASKDAEDPAEYNAENRVSEFMVSADESDRADANSERVLLDINQPRANHNGGQLAFGPDGYLYIGTGDGGGAGDVGIGRSSDLGNGQDRSTLLGKILRIDVNGEAPYAVPSDNPFVDVETTLPEIWAYGLRNAWRFSFDSGGERRLLAGDVGQALFEEVDIIERGGNYGWNRREGTRCFNPMRFSSPPDDCPSVGASGEPLIDPIIEYSHVDTGGRPIGISVIGGHVYRGTAIPSLTGQYVFGDYSRNVLRPDGVLFVADEEDDGSWTVRELTVATGAAGRIGRYILAFARDDDGELYVLTSRSAGPTGATGEVYKIIPTR